MESAWGGVDMQGMADAARELGELLTRDEAKGIADRLAAGRTLTQALVCVRRAKAPAARRLIEQIAASRHVDVRGCADVLSAIAGAKGESLAAAPVWTAPGGIVSSGALNSSRDEMVRSAKTSVICSTFNFQRSSSLWDALREVAARPGVLVKLYIDTAVSDADPVHWKPTTAEIASELAGVEVYRTKRLEAGKPPVRNHAKFIAVDHKTVLVTSANFSESAETGNIELGLRVADPVLVRSIERQLALFEDVLFERVD